MRKHLMAKTQEISLQKAPSDVFRMSDVSSIYTLCPGVSYQKVIEILTFFCFLSVSNYENSKQMTLPSVNSPYKTWTRKFSLSFPYIEVDKGIQ